MELSTPWSYENEGAALHFMIRDGDDRRRIKLKRTENAALYDFLVPRLGREPDQAETEPFPGVPPTA